MIKQIIKRSNSTFTFLLGGIWGDQTSCISIYYAFKTSVPAAQRNKLKMDFLASLEIMTKMTTVSCSAGEPIHNISAPNWLDILCERKWLYGNLIQKLYLLILGFSNIYISICENNPRRYSIQSMCAFNYWTIH